MSNRDIDAPNDKINKAAQEQGYCCAYGYLCAHTGKRDSHKRIANKLGLGVATIEFNRRKIRNGEMVCPGLPKCQKKD
jgi:hypothetical protein